MHLELSVRTVEAAARICRAVLSLFDGPFGRIFRALHTSMKFDARISAMKMVCALDGDWKDVPQG
jgi:hypothetical protein